MACFQGYPDSSFLCMFILSATENVGVKFLLQFLQVDRFCGFTRVSGPQKSVELVSLTEFLGLFLPVFSNSRSQGEENFIFCRAHFSTGTSPQNAESIFLSHVVSILFEYSYSFHLLSADSAGRSVSMSLANAKYAFSFSSYLPAHLK